MLIFVNSLSICAVFVGEIEINCVHPRKIIILTNMEAVFRKLNVNFFNVKLLRLQTGASVIRACS